MLNAHDSYYPAGASDTYRGRTVLEELVARNVASMCNTIPYGNLVDEVIAKRIAANAIMMAKETIRQLKFEQI